MQGWTILFRYVVILFTTTRIHLETGYNTRLDEGKGKEKKKGIWRSSLFFRYYWWTKLFAGQLFVLVSRDFYRFLNVNRIDRLISIISPRPTFLSIFVIMNYSRVLTYEYCSTNIANCEQLVRYEITIRESFHSKIV